MKAPEWQELLKERGVDLRIIGLVSEMAEHRNLEPPTLETQQLLVAAESDGYAAARVGGSVVSLFFDPEEAQKIGARHGFAIGQRSSATWIVRIPAEELDDESRRELASRLLGEALDRIEPLGSWNRGLPDATKTQGAMCPEHFMQRSVTGDCPSC